MWKTIITHPNYEVSSEGQVRNTKTQRILKPSICKGYLRVVLCNNGRITGLFVHRLVAIYHSPEAKEEAYQVDHIDRNTQNNNVSNLRWTTPSENSQNKNYWCKKELHHIYLKSKQYYVDFNHKYIFHSKNLDEAIAFRDNYMLENPK